MQKEDWKIHWEDYYKILGLDHSVEPEVIEGAYRRLARKYHPDVNKDSSAEEKFKKINRAYENLKDLEKRRMYDIEWEEKNNKKGTQSKTDTSSDPPMPKVTPDHISFNNIIPGKKYTASFIVENIGGVYNDIYFPNIDSIPWIKDARFDSQSTSDDLPLQVEIEAEGEQWETSYSEDIIVKLDNEETQVKVELQTQPMSIKVVFWEIKWLIEVLIGKIKTILPHWLLIKKRYILGLIGLFFLIIWISDNADNKSYQKPQSYQRQTYNQENTTDKKVQIPVQTSFTITGTFIDRNKKPIEASCWLTDDQDKQYSKNRHSDKASADGTFKTVAVPDGEYTLHISISSYFGEPRSLEKKVKVSGSDLNLGNVVLPWSWITGTFVDRNGNPVQAGHWLKDNQDKEYCKDKYISGGCKGDTVLSNGTFKTVAVPDGEYTLHISISSYFGEPRSLEKKVKVSGSDLNLGNVVLPWSWITGTFVDRNGNPVQAGHWLKDNQDKEYCKDKYISGGCKGDTVLSNGTFKTVAVPDGEYTLHISISSYFGEPRSLEKKVKVSGSDLNLGNVVLPWSWITGTFVDRNGNPVQAGHWLKDNQDKEYCKDKYISGGCKGDTVLSNGTFKTVAVPDGEYTLHIKANGYQSLERKVTINGKDVSLGQIILIKKGN